MAEIALFNLHERPLDSPSIAEADGQEVAVPAVLPGIAVKVVGNDFPGNDPDLL